MYEVIIPPKVEKQLDKISGKDFDRIFAKILSLEKNPRPTGAVKLRVRELGDYRIRQGDWRIRYDVDDEKGKVYILDVSRRGRAYS